LDELGVDFSIVVQRLREAEGGDTEVLFHGQSLKGYVVVRAENAASIQPDLQRRYVIVCKTGSTAARIAESWREKGITAYALDERTYRRLSP